MLYVDGELTIQNDIFKQLNNKLQFLRIQNEH